MTVAIKDYNVMIDWKNIFEQLEKNDLITYENIRKIATGQGDNYTSGCLLDYNYFKSYYKTVAINLSKQKALDADPKVIQQINFTGKLDWGGQTTMYFIIEETKETILDFLRGTVRVLFFYFVLIWYQHKMTQYNTLNVKLSNSQLNKVKSGIKHITKVTLKLSSDVVGDSNDENNCWNKLRLANTQVSKLRKGFANGLSANTKLSKTELHKIGQSGQFLGRLLEPFLKTGLSFMKIFLSH